ncbi:hypothetical protein LZ31DRAFT_482184 [Colletotrichum somersetense]|nr:hypothetical protein LZ31DRAFT_482184 [Colletotrichum somersetense]
MHLNTLITFLTPIALVQAAIYNASGTCSTDLTCEIDTQYVDPVQECDGRPGRFAGDGNGGKSSCTPAGTKCTYVWEC